MQHDTPAKRKANAERRKSGVGGGGKGSAASPAVARFAAQLSEIPSDHGAADPAAADAPSASYARTVEVCNASERGPTPLYWTAKGLTSVMKAMREEGAPPERTHELLRWVQEKRKVKLNVFHYTNLISTCRNAGEWRRALQVYDEMRHANIAPNQITYNSLISACETGGQWEQALRLKERMLKENIEADVFTYSALIAALEKSGQRTLAFEAFEEALRSGVRPNVVTFSSLMCACANDGEIEQGLELLEKMREMRVKPNLFTFGALITACEKAGDWRRAFEIDEQMRAAGLQGNDVTFSALISACEKGGQWRKAFEVYKRMRAERVEATVITYNALISACHKCGQVKHAFGVLDEMMRVGVMPDEWTYNALISTCASTGEWRAATRVYRAMGDATPRVPATSVTINALLDALWNGGQLAKSAKLIRALRDKGHLVAGQIMQMSAGEQSAEGEPLSASEIKLDLHELSPGAARARIVVWLVDEAEGSLADFELAVIVVGKGLGSRVRGESVVRLAASDMLGALGSPFVHPPNNEGRLVAPAKGVLQWLAEGDVGALLVDGDPQSNLLCKQPADAAAAAGDAGS